MQNQKNPGQVLVLVAFALLVLVGVVMLAVDVGNLYAERRHMQNAADAGALAGARELCFESGDPSTAESVATDYTTIRNRAQFAEVTIEPLNGTIPVTVTVVASETAQTFFGGLIGMGTADVNATASAMCGPAVSASGLWPLVLRGSRFQEFYEQGCDREFYVLLSSDTIVCDTGTDDPDIQEWDCDVLPKDSPDGLNDIFAWRPYDPDDPYSGGDRGWIDFSSAFEEGGALQDDCVKTGCGESEIVCHIERGSGALLETPLCLPSTSGVKSGSKKIVNDRYGDYIQIPLYSDVGCQDGGLCADEPKPATNTCGTGATFCIHTFGCVEVRGWEQFQIELIEAYPEDPDKPDKTKSHALKFYLPCDNSLCTTNVGHTDDDEPWAPWKVKAVNLTK